MFVFQLATKETPANALGPNYAKMDKEWSAMARGMGNVRGMVNGILGGNVNSFDDLKKAIAGLNDLVKDSQFLKKDPSLQAALAQMNGFVGALTAITDMGTAARAFVALDSFASYVELKLAAYNRLASIEKCLASNDLKGAKDIWAGSQEAVGGTGWATYADVFLGAAREDLKEGLSGANSVEQAKKFCEKIYDDVRSIPVNAVNWQLAEVEIIGVKKRTFLGKALRWVISVPDLLDGIEKMKRGNRNKDGYLYQEGFTTASLATIGVISDVFIGAKLLKSLGKGSVKLWKGAVIDGSFTKSLTFGRLIPGSEAVLRAKAEKLLAKEFTTKGIREIVRNNLIAFRETANALAKEVRVVPGGMEKSRLFAKEAMRDFENMLVDDIWTNMGKRLTKDQIRAVVSKETGDLFGKTLKEIMKDVGNRELSEAAVREIVEKKLGEKMVKGMSRNISVGLSGAVLDAEVNAVRFVKKNLLITPMKKSLEDAAKKVGSEEWIRETLKGITTTTALVGKKIGKKTLRELDEFVPALQDRLRKSFVDAFKDVPQEVWKRAGMETKLENWVGGVVNRVKGKVTVNGKILMADAELAAIVKEEIGIVLPKMKDEMAKQMRQVVLEGVASDLLKGVSKDALEKAAKDGKALTGKIWESLPNALRKAGFEGTEIEGIRASRNLVEEAVQAGAANALKESAKKITWWTSAVAKDMYTGATADNLESLYYGKGLVGRFLQGTGWASWTGPAAPGMIGALVKDGGVGIGVGLGKLGKMVWSKAQYVPVTALTGRLTHAGVVATEEAYDKKLKTTVKSATILPGEGIASLDLKYLPTFLGKNDGKIYYRTDGNEVQRIGLVDGELRDAKRESNREGIFLSDLGFGRHRIEISAQKDFDRKTLLIVDVKPPYFDLENGAVVLYAPNSARLASRNLVLVGDDKKEIACTTDANGRLLAGDGKVFSPAEGTTYQVLSKDKVLLGNFTVDNGVLYANRGITGVQFVQASPTQAGEQESANKIAMREIMARADMTFTNEQRDIFNEIASKPESFSSFVNAVTLTAPDSSQMPKIMRDYLQGIVNTPADERTIMLEKFAQGQTPDTTIKPVVPPVELNASDTNTVVNAAPEVQETKAGTSKAKKNLKLK